MADIVSLVPGFSTALARRPGTLGAYGDLVRTLEGGSLSARSRAELGLIVANRIGCDYCRWAMARLAAHAGMSQEDILFAAMGISRGRRESAIARLATRMIDCAESGANARCDPADARMFNEAELAEIVAQLAFATLTCTVLQSVAPRAVPSRREA